MSDEVLTKEATRDLRIIAILVSALASAIAHGEQIEVVTKTTPVEAGKSLSKWCDDVRVQGQSVKGILLDHPFNLLLKHA